jgi:hypothetical protein
MFEASDNAKVVIYDLQAEYGGLLIDTLCNEEDACLIFVSRDAVDENVLRYWEDPNEENLTAAAETLERTTILPKALLHHRQEHGFVAPFRQILEQGKVKLVTHDTAHDLAAEITRIRGELPSITGGGKRVFNRFVDGLVQTYSPGANPDVSETNEENVSQLFDAIVDHIGNITGGTNLARQNSVSGVGGWVAAADELRIEINAIQNGLNTGQTINERFMITRDEILTSLNNSNIKSLFIVQGEEATVRVFSGNLGRDAMENRRRTGNIEPVVAFIYDEADQFIPQKIENTPLQAGARESKSRAVQIARRGRKYGIGIGIGTQRIAYLDTNVLGQPHTYFVSKLPRKYDRETIQGAFGLADETLEQTHRFRKGQWLLISHSATGVDGTPIPITLPNANDRIDEFLVNYLGVGYVAYFNALW